MGKVAIIGKQQPRFIREAMHEFINNSGHQADILDFETPEMKKAIEVMGKDRNSLEYINSSTLYLPFVQKIAKILFGTVKSGFQPCL